MQDSPSQNYAILNRDLGTRPSGIARGTFTVFDAGLRAGQGGDTSFDSTAISTLTNTNRDVYCEVTINHVENILGFAFIDPAIRTGADNTDPVFFRGNQSGTCGIKNAGSTSDDQTFNVDVLNQTFGFHADVSTGQIDVYHNNALLGSSTGWTLNTERTFVFSCNGAPDVGSVSFNYGQRPFQTRPAALGDDTNFTSQNLPEAVIPNPSEHFRVIMDQTNQC